MNIVVSVVFIACYEERFHDKERYELYGVVNKQKTI